MLTNRHRIDFSEVKVAALADIRGVLGRFLPGGEVICGECVVLNPRRADRHPGSFKINIRSGKWSDFAVDAKGGDLILLVAYLKDISQLEAAKGLSRMLGWGDADERLRSFDARRAQRLVRACQGQEHQAARSTRSSAIAGSRRG
jgi:hypothetical protein